MPVRPQNKTTPEGWRHIEVQGYTFPLRHEEVYHFVGSAAFMLRWMDRRIHYYDVALYLDRSSTLWGSQHTNGTKERDFKSMLGNIQFMIVLQSGMASRKAMAALVDALLLFAEGRQLRNVTPVLDQYKRCYRKGPRITMGSLIVLEPNRTGLQISLNGESLCFVESDFLSLLVLDHYLGKRSDFPEFRDTVFRQLEEGMPSEVSLPVVVSRDSHTPWWVTALLVLLGVGACAGLLLFYHSCCRQRSEAREAAA